MKNINILVPTQEDYIKSEKFAKSPPLPPNLIRIMEGVDVLERMGSYLDALRPNGLSNVQDVVGAFEALPWLWQTFRDELLMRSWSAIDPESALSTRKNWMRKVKEDLVFEALAVGKDRCCIGMANAIITIIPENNHIF